MQEGLVAPPPSRARSGKRRVAVALLVVASVILVAVSGDWSPLFAPVAGYLPAALLAAQPWRANVHAATRPRAGVTSSILGAPPLSELNVGLVTKLISRPLIVLSQWFDGPQQTAVASGVDVHDLLTSGAVRRPPSSFFTKEEVLENMAAVPEEFKTYPRTWQPVAGAPSKSFRVLQFNTLAHGLAADPLAEAPFPAERAADLGGFDIPDPRKVLDFRLRRWRLLREIAESDADVICLEEVDHFDDFFQPALAALGYEGVFEAKTKSPSLQFGYYSDGVALFWRKDKLRLGDLHSGARIGTVPYSTPYIAARFVADEGSFVVAATHLKAKAKEEFEAFRCEQIKGVVAAMLAVGRGAPWILAGDLNTEMQDHKKYTAQAIPFVASLPNAQSAYDLDNSRPTTVKARGGTTKSQIPDYIWYDSNLALCGTWEVPEVTEPGLLPGFRYPSDHLAIAADFAFPADQRLAPR
jgi:nocturnin